MIRVIHLTVHARVVYDRQHPDAKNVTVGTPPLEKAGTMSRGIFMAALVLLSACDNSSPTEPPRALDVEDVEFDASLGVDLTDFTRTDLDLHWKTESEGEGDPVASGELVWVDYRGWLPNGVLFDSSEGRDPLDFMIGAPNILPGFSAGIEGMQVGETRTLLIPPHLGYGPAGRGIIPPNSWLVFQVTLVPDPNNENGEGEG